ncbi:MAG: DNA polymerase domain-containing protein [Haloarculaceae archaeon]
MDDAQQDLGAFAEGTDADSGDRPVASEAAAVAGNGGFDAEVVDPDEHAFPAVEDSVEFAVTQVDYTVEGRGDDEFPVIHVFGRTADERLVHARVHEFRPYFYAPTATVSEDELRRYDRITGWESTDADGEPYESIRGERLVKIFGQTPRDVGQIRDEFEHFEADILFPNRLLIDKDITSGVRVPARAIETDDDRLTLRVRHDEIEPVDVDATPRVNTFDIEVDDRSGFPEDGEEPIVCLTSHDAYRDEYVVWLYESPDGVAGPAALDDYEPIREEFDADVRTFEEEAAMLAAFADYIERTDPDVLTGWNFDDFDAPYLLDRMDELAGPDHGYDLDVNRLSRVNEVWRSDWQGPDIKGRVVFDLLRAYRATKFTELESYRLDAVGETELGVGKERYPGDIGDLWEQDPERLLEYNLRDVELCVELDRKQDIIAFFEELSSFVGCKLEDAPTAGDAVDMYVLHKAHGEFALPSKGTVESGEEFEGGAVFEPITGVRENVSVLDLKSLYPMCMWTTNASPETKVDPDEYDGDTYRTPTGQHFRKEPAGMMREMIDELLSEREEKKERRDQHEPGTDDYERYDRQQSSVKVVMNCFTPDTEVLTPDGIRDITDLDVGDEVYSLDPDTLEMAVKPVVETHAYPDYRGELVDIETSKIDFNVTPNHRMLVRKAEKNGVSWDEDDYRFVEAGELDNATNYQLPHGWDGPDGELIDEIDLTEYLDEYEVWVRPDVHGHTFAAEIGYYPDTVKKNDVGAEGYVFDADEFEAHRAYIDEIAEQCFVHAEPGRKWIPRTYDGDDFLELLAWYVTEGNVYTSERKQIGDTLRGSSTTVKIAQNAPAMSDGGSDGDTMSDGGSDGDTMSDGGSDGDTMNDGGPDGDTMNDGGPDDDTLSDHASIGRLLDRMGFDYYVDERAYQFTSRLLGRFLEQECGENSFEKRIPEFVFAAPAEQKRRFLEVLIDGDGDRGGNSWRYSTASDRLRDDVLRLCAHLGLTTNYREEDGTWRIYVNEGSKNTLRMHRSATRSSAENGVYCVTVADNHTLLAGRNGRFQFVGQSLYGVSGWDRFRLYDKDNAAAVTATGREVISYTEGSVNDFGFEVIYGDTDSVMISLGSDKKTDEIIDSSLELEERINDSYDAFAREELNADEHRFQIEFEKLYRRFFQAGKKKRYAGHIVWKEGKDVDDVDITGFEYQRSDIAPITKEVQKRVIDMIVHGEDLDDVTEYVHGVIEEFQTGEVDLDEVGIPGGIGKKLDNYDTDTAHVRGAKYANTVLGTNFARGSKPKRLYLERVHSDFFERVEEERDLDVATDPVYAAFKSDPDVICFEYADQIPDEFEVDWEKMLEKTLRGPIARILEALDISWEEVRSGQEQTGLGQYM